MENTVKIMSQKISLCFLKFHFSIIFVSVYFWYHIYLLVFQSSSAIFKADEWTNSLQQYLPNNKRYPQKKLWALWYASQSATRSTLSAKTLWPSETSLHLAKLMYKNNKNNTGTPSGGTILKFQKQAQESGNHSKEHNWEKTWLFFQKNQLDLQK